MEFNYTAYDNNIYNVTPMTMDTMNYEYIIDNLDNSMNKSICEPEPNDNIVFVIHTYFGSSIYKYPCKLPFGGVPYLLTFFFSISL